MIHSLKLKKKKFICLVVYLRVPNVTTNILELMFLYCYHVACHSIGRNTKEKKHLTDLLRHDIIKSGYDLAAGHHPIAAFECGL